MSVEPPEPADDELEPATIRFRPRTVWQELPLLALCLVAQIAATTTAVRAHFARHNALIDGHWRMTKLDLERPVPGANAFARDRQALATGAVNLRSWHGFHELIHDSEFAELSSLDLDLFLGKEAWVAVILRGADPTATERVIRFSLNAAFASAVLTVSPEGQFLDRQPFTAPLRIGTWHHARLELAGDDVRVLIDGHESTRFTHGLGGPYRFGVRGGRHMARVDNVIASGPGHQVVERFERSAEATRATVVASALLVALNLLVFGWLRRRYRPGEPPPSFRLLLVSLTILVVVAVGAWFIRYQATRYPDVGPQLLAAEFQVRKVKTERVARQLERLYPPEGAADHHRILFVGSSQTWGQGATRESEVFTVVLERLLNGNTRTDYQCINSGIPSARAVDLAPLVANWVTALRPRLVVINLANNDRGSSGDDFVASVRAMIESIRGAGGLPVLVKEANSWSAEPGALEQRHAELEALGNELGVPVIDLHGYLSAHHDDGFLWWDDVHMASLGQRLTAEFLDVELRRLNLVD